MRAILMRNPIVPLLFALGLGRAEAPPPFESPPLKQVTSWVGNTYPGLQDIRECLAAHRRGNGEFIVFLEDDYKSKVVMYRWDPTP
jgi:hypothetical protein